MFKLGIGRTQTQEIQRIDMKDLKNLGMLEFGYACRRNISWTSSSNNKSSISIEINLIHKNNMFSRLKYISNNIHFNYDYKIVRSKCNYGGYRFWFICNNDHNIKTRILYLNRNTGKFCCRKCANVIYESQNISYNGKFWSRLNRIKYLEHKIQDLENTKILYEQYKNKKTKRIKKIEKLEYDLDLLKSSIDFINCRSL